MQRAWCFDHGTLHRFDDDNWCTAAWVALDGSTDEEALRQKELIWGPAQFFDQLDLDRQGGLVGMLMTRRDRKTERAAESS